MPMRRRTRSTSTPRAGDLVALDADAAGVDRLEQVDAAQQRRLAAARRADEADDLVLGHVEVDAAQDLEVRRTTCAAPRSRAATRRAGTERARSSRHRAPWPAGACGRVLTSQSTKRASGMVSSRKISGTGEVRREVERWPASRIWVAPEDLDDADERHERRVLLEADEVVQQRRDDAPDGLRQDDVAQRLEARQAERPRRRLLARVDRLDAGPVDLATRTPSTARTSATTAQKNGSLGTPGMPQRGDAEAEDVDDQDARQARNRSM